MSPAEELDALRRIAVKQPRISARRAMRLIAEQKAIRATTELLRASERMRRDAERMAVMAGSTEGLV